MTRKLVGTIATIFIFLSLIFNNGSRSEGSEGVRKSENKGVVQVDFFSLTPLLPYSPTSSALPLVSGTKTVGTAGDYASITAAIADIQANGLDGALTLELLPTYTSGGETFPLNFTNLTGISATNTLTLRPQAGATNRAITGSNATAIINLDNAQFVTIDGRAGGAGTVKDLTIENTNTSGATIRFINEASNNTIKHTTVKGVTTSASSGVIFFSTTTGANGNDNNAIDNCDIRDGATTPFNGIFSQGTTTTTAHNNSNNTISNNNIFNFYAANANESAGVRLNAGNTDWTISGNNFFQTSVRAAVANSVRGIFINNTSGNNFTVTNNAIGGSTQGAGGTAWTTTGTTVNYRFVGIQISVGSTTASNVHGNVISNFVWTTSSTNTTSPGAWCGIFVNAGLVNVGTTAGNTIGSGTGTGSVNVTTSGNLGTTIGIGTNTFFAANFSNNVIGSITTNGTTTSINASLMGILATGSGNIFNNNTIGSTTTANSLNAATSASFGTVTGQQVAGIQTQNASTITNNTIANLNNNYVGTASVGQTRGIVSTAITGSVITGNTIRNLTTTSANTGSGNTASVVGISQVSIFATQNHTISQNTIHTLSNSAAGAVKIYGIRYDGGTSTGTNVFDANFIHSLTASNQNANTTALSVNGGTGTFTNNVIRLGIDSSGNSITLPIEIVGIHVTAGKHTFLHNSLYIGGTNVAPFQGNRIVSDDKKSRNGNVVMSNHTDAPLIKLEPGLNTNDVYAFVNNSFQNERSDAVPSGNRYVIYFFNAPGVIPQFLSHHNAYHVSGTGSVFGSIVDTDISTLNGWRRTTGQDGPSFVANPLYTNPTAATPNLRPQTNSPLEGNGTSADTTALDADGQNRSANTPTDNGAYSFNGNSPTDLSAPFSKYLKLLNGSTSNRILTNWLTVTDNVGIAGGSLVPRIYYSKDGVNYASEPCVEFNGLTEQTKRYDCVIDYVDIGGVMVGDTIFYHVVAQDLAGNVGSNPPGVVATDVNTITMHPSNPNTFQIRQGVSGTMTVGMGGDFSCFTCLGGLFEFLNSVVQTGVLNINIISDTNEDGALELNKIAQNNFPPTLSLTIVPGDASPKTLSGSSVVDLFRFNGVENLNIDGSFNGTGKLIIFRNLDNAGTITLENGSKNVDISNSCIEGGNPNANSAVIHIKSSGTDFNEDIKFNQVIIRDLSNTTGVPQNLFLSQGAANVPNKNITLKNSDLVNFTARAIYFLSSNESALIQGNTICSEGSFAFNAVENDFQPNCTAAPRTTPLTAVDFNGDGLIDLNDARIATTLAATGARLKVADNGSPIPNVRLFANRFLITPPANSTGAQIGTEFQGGGTGTFDNNQITIFLNGSNQSAFGILNQSGDGVFQSFFNDVFLFGTGGNTDTAAVMTSPTSTKTEEHIDNQYVNAVNGTGNSFSVIKLNSGITYNMDFNVFSGRGATIPENHYNANGSLVPLSIFRIIVGGNADSIDGNGNVIEGDYADPLNGNLNKNTGVNYDQTPIGSNAGTAIPGVIKDFNGNPRTDVLLQRVDIGSHEFNVNRNLTGNGTLQPGNYDNINVGAGGGFGGGVTTTLGGIINVSGAVSVNCNSMLAGASPTNFVVGNVKKDFCAAGAFDYPVGTSTGYSPVNANVTALNTNPSSLTVKANNGTAVSNPPLNDVTTLDRFWSLSETGALTANLLFNYLDADVDGNESNYRLIRIANGGAPFSMTGSIVNPMNNTLSLNNVTEFSDWTGGEFVPTGARAMIGGRVVRADGSGIYKATIVLQDSRGGQPHSVVTNPFGYFSFTDVPVGETYLLSVSAKQHQFAQPTQILFVIGDTENVTFVALE